MSERLFLATFEHEDDLLGATKAVRSAGLPIVDAFTPYAVHGLDEAMGLKPSRLTWVCFICGITGGLGMLWFQSWTSSVNWAIDVGGKPWNSLPSDVPVAFEAAVLLAAFGTVLALFLVSRMFPGRNAVIVDRRVTDDRFVLVIDEPNAAIDGDGIAELLQPYRVTEVEERLRLQEGASP